MLISDQNVLKVIDELKSSGRVKFKTQVYDVMNTDTVRVHKILKPQKHKQNYHFSAEQIRLLCESYGINSNFIFGLETNMYLK